MSKKDSFIFYRSFFEAINDLPDESQLIVYRAVSSYALNFREPKLKGLSKTIFTLIYPQLKANNQRYINGLKGAGHGHKGGRPITPNLTPKKPLKNPKVTPNLTPNKNVNVNVNVNKNNNIKEAQEKMLEDERRKLTERSKVIILKDNLENNFDIFWKNYTPIKILDGKVTSRGSKQTALPAYLKAIAKHTPEVIINGLERYLKHCQANSILTCGATVFLNQERFLNDDTVVIDADTKTKEFKTKELTLEEKKNLRFARAKTELAKKLGINPDRLTKEQIGSIMPDANTSFA